MDKPYEKSPAENYHASFVQNLMRPHVSPPSGPAVDEYSALQKQIDAGHYVDPHEIWDVVQALMEEGHTGYAEKLAELLPDEGWLAFLLRRRPCGLMCPKLEARDDWQN